MATENIKGFYGQSERQYVQVVDYTKKAEEAAAKSKAYSDQSKQYRDEAEVIRDETQAINDLTDQVYNDTVLQATNAATSASNAATSAVNAAQSAADAQDAADSIGRYQGLWPDTGGLAEKGETYQTQVGGTPTGEYYTALKNTSVYPVGDNVNWREGVTIDYVNEAQNEIIGGSIFRGSNGEYVQNGEIVPIGTTHIKLGEKIFRLSKTASGVISNIKTNSEGVGYEAEFAGALVSLIQSRIPDVTAYGKAFGMVCNGISDDTEQFWNALDWLEEQGGGRLILDGDILVSLANSKDNNCCILIPANVEIYSNTGASISRVASERGSNGVLLCNRGYKDPANNGTYTAAGNIVIDGLTITDGSASPNRSAGDLIGFGNADGLVVQNCNFGNHDQHAVDFCRSRNGVIRWNESSNDINLPFTATYQIDAGLIWGIPLEWAKVGSSDVFIYENRIKKSFANWIIHFHTEAFAENVFIFDNNIDATNLVKDQAAIGGDNDISYKNTHIFRNTIKLNHAESRGINLPSDDTVSLVENLRIYDNKISGKFRLGISAGDELRSTTDFSGPLVSAFVYDNQLTVDCTQNTGNTYKIINLAGFRDCSIRGNSIRIACDGQLSEISCIGDIGNRHCGIKDNNVVRIDTGTNPSNARGIKQDFEFNVANGHRKIFDTKNNTVDFAGCTIHIAINNPTSSVDTYTTFNGVVSGNMMLGDPTFVHLYEAIPVSDGTNNLQYVDFSSHGGVAGNPQTRAVNKQQYIQNVPLTAKKAGGNSNQRMGKKTLDIMFSPSIAGLSADTEMPVVAYLSSTTSTGVIFKDVDLQNGYFDLVTGSDGVSMTINDSGFHPVIRESGYIKILCGV